MGRFDGQVAVITGGATGIGLATARAFVGEGASVVLAGRDAGRGEQAAESLGGAAMFVQTDVTDDSQVTALAETAVAKAGRLDIWFNNAGIEGHTGSFLEAGDAAVRQVLDTNVKGVYAGMREAAKRMPDGGVIVNTSSFVGTTMPVPVSVAYGSTKAAVVSMTRSVAVALDGSGIDVFAICPYIVDTPMIDRLTGGQGPEVKEAFAAQFAPSKRLTPPGHVADVVLSLCTRTSGHPSGSVLLVDAGPEVAPLP